MFRLICNYGMSRNAITYSIDTVEQDSQNCSHGRQHAHAVSAGNSLSVLNRSNASDGAADILAFLELFTFSSGLKSSVLGPFGLFKGKVRVGIVGQVCDRLCERLVANADLSANFVSPFRFGEARTLVFLVGQVGDGLSKVTSRRLSRGTELGVLGPVRLLPGDALFVVVLERHGCVMCVEP